MAAKLIGTTSGVEVDTTANKEMLVSTIADRIAVAPKYYASTFSMNMATTAAGVVVAALNNPTGSGKNLYITRADWNLMFVGTAAATRQSIAASRATGTAAGGSSNIATTAIAKRDPGSANSIATFYRGPTAITGLTADAGGDFSVTHQGHQVGQNSFGEFMADKPGYERASEPLIIVPGTSLILITRDAASVAGEYFLSNLGWVEI